MPENSVASEYLHRQQSQAERVGKELSGYFNRGGDALLLAEEALNDHPTLQQRQMGFVMAFIRGMAEKEYVDARNEASRDLARAIVKAVGPDHYLPFI